MGGDDKPDRPMGKQTSIVRQKELDAEVERERLQLERDKLALESKKIDASLEAKKLDNADHDAARDDKRSFARTVGPWVLAAMALLMVAVVTIAAFRYGRDFDFTGFGFSATTGGKDGTTVSGEVSAQPAPPAQDTDRK